jgi:dihydroorotate dehydrogenase
MKKRLIVINGYIYRSFLRKIIFLLNSEIIHELLTSLGEAIGNIRYFKNILKYFTRTESSALEQILYNVRFSNPVGLAAGFDYDAKLTKFTTSLGFGFSSIGTITNLPYGGNPKPWFGRLVKSRSLMVNKGFKNIGIKYILEKLQNFSFEIPIGISIGSTNTVKLSTHKQVIDDIINAFKKTMESRINFSYYELNISCPNLVGNISFYKPIQLEKLLTEIKKLKLNKLLFIKMPIEKSNNEVLEMLDVIHKFPVQGVIFGNLQKNKEDPAFNRQEVDIYKVGNFSGKPTERRSNELIKLTYKVFGKRLLIIGCGGIFNAEDAYRKIKLGASLVQLITGLIFEGPFLPAQINIELIALLRKDGFRNISEAIGVDVN